MMRKRIQQRMLLRLLIAALLPTLFGSPSAWSSDEERIKLRYLRDKLERPAQPKPPTGTLPQRLHMELPEEARAFSSSTAGASTASPGRAVRTRRPVPPPEPPAEPTPQPPELDELAVQAALWTAEEISRTVGWREYYRVGVYEGIRAALRDESLGSWDYLQGLRLGRRDPEARRLGSDVGSRAGEDAAYEAAEAQVSGQFMDLSREPRYAPRIQTPPYSPRGIWAVPPELSEVFLDYPIAGYPRMSRRLAAAFEDWRFDPWGLYRCASYEDFHDLRWADPDRAFDFWKSRPRRSAVYRRLRSREERRRFEEVFKEEFANRVPFFFEQYNLRAFNQGFEDGWSYGAFIGYEWHYRLGYNEGFNQSVVSSALTSFPIVHRSSYRRFYDQAFTDWSENPKPDILAVTLSDSNDDGVFEPGEEVLAHYELANYGGGVGIYVVELEGRVLERPAEASVRLSARDVLRGREPVRAVISPRTPVRTRTKLDFRLADLQETLRLQVSYPLEFTGDVSLDRLDTLEGRATVVARVVNRSRRPVRGVVDLARIEGYDIRDSQALGVLDAGETGSTAFELEGIRPLDLLSGNLRVRLSAGSSGVIHDELQFPFPDLSLDLNSRDLLRFMVALSRDEPASNSDIAATRSLMLRRLRADWKAAVRGRGNPYKDDYRHQGTRTALGDLVQTHLREKGHVRRPEVFAGLDVEVLALAEELPGAHPFLRKYMKRLARRLR